jgi:hypothetical protein
MDDERKSSKAGERAAEGLRKATAKDEAKNESKTAHSLPTTGASELIGAEQTARIRCSEDGGMKAVAHLSLCRRDAALDLRYSNEPSPET